MYSSIPHFAAQDRVVCFRLCEDMDETSKLPCSSTLLSQAESSSLKSRTCPSIHHRPMAQAKPALSQEERRAHIQLPLGPIQAPPAHRAEAICRSNQDRTACSTVCLAVLWFLVTHSINPLPQVLMSSRSRSQSSHTFKSLARLIE